MSNQHGVIVESYEGFSKDFFVVLSVSSTVTTFPCLRLRFAQVANIRKPFMLLVVKMIKVSKVNIACVLNLVEMPSWWDMMEYVG